MKEKKVEEKKSFFREYVPYLVVLLVVILIKKFVISPVKVNGKSMMNTLHDGDIMILDIIGYRFHDIKRFDIVVVRENNEFLIKRVIGLPGETVEYKNNKLYINDKLVKESYGSDVTDDFFAAVDKDHYFVMGDNRTNSLDSRVLGSFSRKDIVGKTNLIVFPFSRIGMKK